MDSVPLIDELAASISNQSIAQRCSYAPRMTFLAQQDSLLTRFGTRSINGRALWKSLMATSGYITVFITADIRECDPQYTVVIVGSLRTNSKVLRRQDVLRPSLLGHRHNNVDVPPCNQTYIFRSLAASCCSLGDEHAGHRNILERLPFAE